MIVLHQIQHFPNGGFQSDADRATDDAVADVQFHQIRNLMQRREVQT